MSPLNDRRDGERGAILIHVALAVIALLAFSTFVVDYGAFWLSRRQAQNAADAGALAGAIALVYDGPETTVGGRAHEAAKAAALANFVFGQSPSVEDGDITFVCPDGTSDGTCVRVDTFRTSDRGNALPMFAGLFVGLNTQNVQASATAKVAAANASDCLRPFAVPDIPYTLEEHLGTTVEFRDDPGEHTGPGWYRLLDLIGPSGGGAPEVRAAIRTCAADVHAVGEPLNAENGEIANIYRDINAMVDLDPSAYVDSTTGQVVNSCADTGSCDKWEQGNGNNWNRVPDPGRSYSPRVVPIPTFDLAHYNATGEIIVTNIFGFFLLPAQGPPNFSLQGVLVTQPGLFVGGGGVVDPTAAFTKVVQLIR